MENGKSNTWANQLENLGQVFGVEPEEFLKEDSNIQENKNQQGGMAIQNNGKIETVNLSDEKVIELLESRLREKDEMIAFLKKKYNFGEKE